MIAAAMLPKTQTLIMAGGQGERLFPLTVSRPKPAVSFGGIFRIIDFTLSNCLHSELQHVSVLTQYKQEELHTYIRQGWRQLWNGSSREKRSLSCLPPASGKRYRGTADAVFQNLPIIQSEKPEFVLILSGDHIYHMDYRDLLRQHKDTDADVTIATVAHPLADSSHFGVVQVDRDFRVIGFAEKPRQPQALPSRPDMALISMGVYIFRTDTLEKALLSQCESGMGRDFGHDILPSLIESDHVYAYDFRDEKEASPRYWRDIGTIDSYYRASMDLLLPVPPFDPYVNENKPSDPTRHPMIDGQSVLRSRINTDSRVTTSVLSPGVHIDGGADIESSILMPGVRVGRGVRLRRAIVEEGVEIPAGFRGGFDLEHDRNHCTVTDTGVVVVGRTANQSKPAVMPLADRSLQIRLVGGTGRYVLPVTA